MHGHDRSVAPPAGLLNQAAQSIRLQFGYCGSSLRSVD
jgi:hypothetical protein